MLSLTTQYAIRTMIEMARCGGEEYVSVAELAKRTRVPKPYLAKIIKQLVKSGYLHGRKGPGGGVVFSARGRRSSFYDICLATNEPLVRPRCLLSRGKCNSSHPCPFHNDVRKISAAMAVFLKKSKFARKSALGTGSK